MCSFISHWEPIANDSLPSGVNDRVIISSCFLHLVSPNDAVIVLQMCFHAFHNFIQYRYTLSSAILAKGLSKKQPESRGF